MQFRWVAAIALWTFLIGPVIGPRPSSAPPAAEKRPVVHKLKP